MSNTFAFKTSTILIWVGAILSVVALIVTVSILQSKQDNATCADAFKSGYDHGTSCADYWRDQGLTVQ